MIDFGHPKRAVPAIGALFLAVAVAVFFYHRHATQPRRDCLRVLDSVALSLQGENGSDYRDTVVTPPFLRNSTAPEIRQFIEKALRTELSPAGLQTLSRKGRFGHLGDLFPDEAAGWVEPHGIPVKDCFAFSLEKNGIRVLAVLWRNEEGVFRLLRVDNVHHEKLDPSPTSETRSSAE